MFARATTATCALALTLGACAWSPGAVEDQPSLARGYAATDLSTYEMRRVAVVPFTGAAIDPERSKDFEDALALELIPRASFELVQLDAADLAEIPRADPYRRGWYQPFTLLEIAKRYRVDAVLVGTVREFSPYTPQRLSASIEMVSCETGMVAWSSSVVLDGRDERVLRGLKAWHALERGSHDAPGDEALSLLSPSLFARFAARELSRTYPDAR